jgi:N,N'-diacetyllegionaminate synthase
VQAIGLHAVTLMHCVSAYPTPLAQLNLSAIGTSYAAPLGPARRLTGFSDHSGILQAGAWAVAAGATVVEAHMRLPDTEQGNPDAGSFAFPPDAFAQYVTAIRSVERALGSGRKELQPCEGAMQHYRMRA